MLRKGPDWRPLLLFGTIKTSLQRAVPHSDIYWPIKHGVRSQTLTSNWGRHRGFTWVAFLGVVAQSLFSLMNIWKSVSWWECEEEKKKKVSHGL